VMSNDRVSEQLSKEVANLFLDTTRLYPLPQSMWNAHCDHCDKRQSRWLFIPTDMSQPEEARGPGKIHEEDHFRARGHIMCSLCWLYESTWGQGRRSEIDALIRKFEFETKSILARSEGGRLWSCRDADRVLAMIALMSRIFVQSCSRPVGADEGDEKNGGSDVG
jgi:hypothetical protein